MLLHLQIDRNIADYFKGGVLSTEYNFGHGGSGITAAFDYIQMQVTHTVLISISYRSKTRIYVK